MTSSTRNRKDEDFEIYLAPIETEDKLLYEISPLAIVDHVQNEPDRELSRIYRDNSVEYRVKGGVNYYQEDPTQKKWNLEYGVEFFVDGPMDGIARKFVEYEPVHSSSESAQTTIDRSIFQRLEERSLIDYERKGFEQAAEILGGQAT